MTEKNVSQEKLTYKFLEKTNIVHGLPQCEEDR
jgi:hypothetical protein